MGRPLYPTVWIGDKEWDRVLKALRQRNTKADAALADRIERQVSRVRERVRQDREAPPAEDDA